VQGIDLKLKNVSAMGVYGWNSICETVAAEWLEDISKNQVLISPMHNCTFRHA
jgi:autophagy-related protein 2